MLSFIDKIPEHIAKQDKEDEYLEKYYQKYGSENIFTHFDGSVYLKTREKKMKTLNYKVIQEMNSKQHLPKVIIELEILYSENDSNVLIERAKDIQKIIEFVENEIIKEK